MTDVLNEFLAHDASLWGRERKIIRVCKGQNKLILNELKKTMPGIETLSDNKGILLMFHLLEISLKERNPKYVRFCESDHYKRNR